MNKNNNNRKIDYDLNEVKIDNIISTILALIQPSRKDVEKVKSIEKKIIDEIKNYKIPQIVDVQTGGSFAKDTNLKKDMDIDIFILIDTNVNEVDFERIALDIGFKALKKYNPITRYSEHPYVEGVVNIDNKKEEQIRLNIVPCYNVEKGKWKSAADRSQYHTAYMQKMLKPYQKNQIRILKAFLKRVGIYGAELSTSGFSGYVTEVLVLKFGNFKNVIKFIASLTRDNEIITIDDDFHEINNKKFQSPIIIIDPIDSNRNLGKAISSESLSRFIYAARAFLTNPSVNFFKIERKKEAKNTDYVPDNIDNLLPNILILEFSFRLRSPDIIWGQLKKLTKSIGRLFNENDFTAIKSGCYIYGKNSARLIFLLKYTILPPFFEKKGPSIFMENEVFQFVNKNKDKKNLFVLWITEEMELICLSNRKIIDAIKFLEYAIMNEKCNNIGIPRGLINDFDKGFKIYTLNKNRLKNKDNQTLVLDFLFKDMKLFGSRY